MIWVSWYCGTQNPASFTPLLIALYAQQSLPYYSQLCRCHLSSETLATNIKWMRMFNNVTEVVANPIKKEMEGISFWPNLVVLLWTWSSRNCHFSTNNGKELLTGQPSMEWLPYWVLWKPIRWFRIMRWDTVCLHCLMQSLIPPHLHTHIHTKTAFSPGYSTHVQCSIAHSIPLQSVSFVKHRLLYAINHHQNYIDSACFFQTDILPDWT